MSIQQDLIQKKLDEIATIQNTISKLENTPIDFIHERFPSNEVICYDWADVTFVLPFQFELIDEIKSFMQEYLPAYTFDYEARDAYSTYAEHRISFASENKKVSFDVCFTLRTNVKGTTCVLNQIGTKVIPAKEVPVFEVICQAGAEEGSF